MSNTLTCLLIFFIGLVAFHVPCDAQIPEPKKERPVNKKKRRPTTLNQMLYFPFNTIGISKKPKVVQDLIDARIAAKYAILNYRKGELDARSFRATGTQGMPIEILRAEQLFKKAIDAYSKINDFARLIHEDLATLYFEFGQFDKSLIEARAAAEVGSGDSMRILGIFYLDGVAVKQDKQRAIEWFKESVKHDCHRAAVELTLLLIEQDRPKKEIKEAIEYVKTGSDSGDRDCHFVLAGLINDGRYVDGEPSQAQSLLFRATATSGGHALAASCLGKLLDQKADYKMSFRFHLQAAKKGVVTSQERLGQMYARGEGVPANFQQAKYWSILAADHGSTEAKSDYKTVDRQEFMYSLWKLTKE